MKTFFGLIFSKDIDDEILLSYQENLLKEIDFLVIYGGLTLTEAYLVPVVRRKIFINNFTHFKSIEERESKKRADGIDDSVSHRPNFDNMKFQ